MARTKPSKSGKDVGLNWQDYYTKEAARLRREHPKMKAKAIQKQAGKNYQSLKKQVAEQRGMVSSATNRK
ncbi:hypothetical protein JCM8097_005682 [Rhodosporidiobolus ruineniae]